jgi:hypothetical protein
LARAAERSADTRLVRGKFYVADAVISTRGPWARAALNAKARYRKTVQGVLAVFKFSRGGWTLRELGSSGVGCDVGMSQSVMSDLKIACPE